MKHLDLFSGIGGFALAALPVWGSEYENVGFCEIDRYCQELLKIRFPGAKIYDDIKTLEHKGEVDIITGGFPCQPFSQAGKRNGTEDDRHLWPYMLKVIAEVKPTWVIGENVFGIASMAVGQSEADVESETDNADGDNGESGADGVLWTVINDLEQIGYAVQTFVIPACGVNAPHKRDRVWIIANARHGNGEGAAECGEHERENRQGNAVKLERPVKCNVTGIDTNTTSKRPDLGQCNRGERYVQDHERTATEDNTERNGLQRGTGEISSDVANSTEQGGKCGKSGKSGKQTQPKKELLGRNNTGEWHKNWLEVATRLCGVDDGLPAGLDGFKLSKAGHRVARLKGLGNAIVPQVVIEIMKCIKQIDSKD